MQTVLNLCRQLNIKVMERAALADYTTFRLGGACRRMYHCHTPDQIQQLVSVLQQTAAVFVVVGGGSNLLVSDHGLEGDVIRYCSPSPHIERHANRLVASASTPTDDLARFSAEQGLRGLEFLTGIYGTIGGAISGNAGAFGRQISDCLHSVFLCDRHGHMRHMLSQQLGFCYRDSNLKSSGDIIISARFDLTPADPVSLLNERGEVLNLRRRKHPDIKQLPSAGSIFRNLAPSNSNDRRQAVGWFLEQAGAKTLRRGGARVFERHANIIVTDPQAVAQDVYDLIQAMKDCVKQRFDLDLVREIRFAGRFEDAQNPLALIW